MTTSTSCRYQNEMHFISDNKITTKNLRAADPSTTNFRSFSMCQYACIPTHNKNKKLKGMRCIIVFVFRNLLLLLYSNSISFVSLWCVKMFAAAPCAYSSTYLLTFLDPFTLNLTFVHPFVHLDFIKLEIIVDSKKCVLPKDE